MVQPLVSRLVLGGDGHGTALLRSAATSTSRTTVAVPGTGTAQVWSYDGDGPSARPHHQHCLRRTRDRRTRRRHHRPPLNP